MDTHAESREGVVLPDGLDDLLAQLRAPGREDIVLSCAGEHRALTIINRRFVRKRCRQKKCRRDDGAKVFHIWDSATGRLVDTEIEYHDGRVIRPEEE